MSHSDYHDVKYSGIGGGVSPPERVVMGGIGTVSDGGSVFDGHFDDAVEAERAYLAGAVPVADEVEAGDDGLATILVWLTMRGST
jgi:hypothetical protein